MRKLTWALAAISVDNPSEQAVEQRIRNRIWEYCEGVATYESEPWIDLEEIINLWEDLVHRPLQADTFPSPVYSTLERERLEAVDAAWLQFADSIPRQIPAESVNEILRSPEWTALVARCEEAIQEFSKRGRFSEEVDFDFSAESPPHG